MKRMVFLILAFLLVLFVPATMALDWSKHVPVTACPLDESQSPHKTRYGISDEMKLVTNDMIMGKTTLLKAVIENGVDVNKRFIIEDSDDTRYMTSGTLLHAAIMYNQPEAVKILLENGADIEARNHRRIWPIYLAAAEDNLEILKMLIEHGANIYSTGGGGQDLLKDFRIKGFSKGVREYLLEIKRQKLKNYQTPKWDKLITRRQVTYFETASLNRYELDDYLQNGGDVNGSDEDGNTLLHFAAKDRYAFKHMETLIVKHKLDVNATNVYGESPLHWACEEDQPDAVRILIDHGADINLRDVNKNTPLIVVGAYALRESSGEDLELAIAKMLIENGAEVNAQSVFGRTCLYGVAGDSGDKHQKLRKLLLDSGADVNLPDNQGKTSLHIASSRGCLLFTKQLLEAGADPEIINMYDCKPIDVARNGKQSVIDVFYSFKKPSCLIDAAYYSQPDAIEKLVQNGADIEHFHPDYEDGATSLIIAAKKNDIKVLKKLLELKANVNTTDVRDYTALHYAAAMGNDDVLHLLLKAKVDLTLKNKQGHTAFDLAILNEKFRAMQLFMDEYPDIQATPKTAKDEVGVVEADEEFTFLELPDESKKAIRKMKAKRFLSMTDKPLHTAVIDGDLETVKKLIEINKNSVKEIDISGLLPIGYATLLSDKDMVKLLIKNGADINQVDESTSIGDLVGVRTGAHYLSTKAGFSVMHYVVAASDYEMLDFMVAQGADLDIPDVEWKRSPIFTACSLRNKKMIKALAKAGADLMVKNNRKMTILEEAVESGKSDIIKLMLDLGVKADLGQLLLAACRGAQKDIAIYLIAAGADVNYVDSKGQNILHRRITSMKTEILQILLEYGIDVNRKDKKGNVPLFYIRRYGSSVDERKLHKLNMLLKAGADIKALDENGYSLLQLAIKNYSIPLTKFCIKNGLDVNEVGSKNMTALSWFLNPYSTFNDPRVPILTKLLLDNGADISVIDKWGCTLLHNVARKGNLELVEYFIKEGLDVNARDKKKETALHKAASLRYKGRGAYDKLTEEQIANNAKIVKILIDNGADVNAKDKDNETPLHYAARKVNSTETIKLLLKAGVNKNVKNKSGKTPLDYAIEYKDQAVIDLL